MTYHNTRLVRGDRLTPEQRNAVLRAYVHRQLDTTCKSDDEWLAARAFYITKNGKLAANRFARPASMATE